MCTTQQANSCDHYQYFVISVLSQNLTIEKTGSESNHCIGDNSVCVNRSKIY